MYFLGEVMFGDSAKNWFVYIAQSYPVQQRVENPDLGVLG